MQPWKTLTLAAALGLGLGLGTTAAQAAEPAAQPAAKSGVDPDILKAASRRHEQRNRMEALHAEMAATVKELKALPQNCPEGTDPALCMDMINQRLNLIVHWMSKMDECEQACGGSGKMCRTGDGAKRSGLPAAPAGLNAN